ncbi:glycoside hydrolase family 16 protein [Microvirga terrae]|uniref:Glycoside hydrolase family 16 protein n=1 Tax=Microvirga terrae TaxID=2740529 RepID=A0ABY5RN82_9HYPH|nr:glycoside hydrolase family 16 protein [Microvirga terrae]UVF18413.1 glycoside hydrolase family 16 protein [Microvirga terrae]
MFQDDFNASSLDITKWKTSDLWGNQTLAANGEKQCYLPTSLEQSDGTLKIVAAKGNVLASQCKSAVRNLEYSSGMITSSGCNKWEKGVGCQDLSSFSQAYGYFEVRAKVPKGKGLWSAFWLLPIDGSWPPEIDIMEVLGSSTTQAVQTYHFNDTSGKRAKAGTSYSGSDFSTGFHSYGVDWQPGKLIWYVDGKETYRFSSPSVSAKPMYLLLNLAIGGHWPGDPDAATPFPSTMEVDYVKVYRRTKDGTPDDTPPHSTSPLKSTPSDGPR